MSRNRLHRPKAATRARASKRSAPANRARIEVQIPARHARAIRAADLAAAARAALDVERIQRVVALTIAVRGDATLRQLNRGFLGIDAPTDVLSFALETAGRPEYLGDVVISLARARLQARAGGHPLVDELRLLVIHGVLHLLNHDHATPAQQKRMWAAQAKALRKVRASIEGPAA